MSNQKEPEKKVKQEIIDKLAHAIVRRGMSVPAVFFMQTFKPMNFIGSQVIVFFGPILESLFPRAEIYEFADFMEERENMELLIERIEAIESEKEPKKKKKCEKQHFFKRKKDKNR
ncbi:MAG: hypothetical protein PHS99_06050 [Candidatus Marinimicrobia bacterium]|nr:hypothetical protein [Candidatus Neomarinimicrobiota bacterium]